jgi:aldose 1-epimerase
MRFSALCLAPFFMLQAANYTVERVTTAGVEEIVLRDAKRNQEVRVAPAMGNNSHEYRVNGKRVFFSPYQTLAEWKAKPTQIGNPFLAPFANRIDSDSYHVNGKHYRLNPDLKNYRIDAFQQPIHGLVVYASQWTVREAKASSKAAWVTSRLELWKQPEWMAQFPFAHEIEMTYRLSEGKLEVDTLVRNLSAEPMPLSLGFHPYFQVNDAPRDAWKVHLAAKEHVMLSDKLTPTGERKPVTQTDFDSLAGVMLDNVYTGLIRDAQGRAEFSVQGKQEKVSVIYGPKYPVAVVYAPPGRDFICFEPMTAVTNIFNLAHRKAGFELQVVAPGGSWRESFWIWPQGF